MNVVIEDDSRNEDLDAVASGNKRKIRKGN